MKIGCRCAKCNNFFMQEEDDLMIELDFKDMKISFVCRNPKCKHENVFDLSNWQKKQEHSPLPRMKLM